MQDGVGSNTVLARVYLSVHTCETRERGREGEEEREREREREREGGKEGVGRWPCGSGFEE